MFKDAYFFLFSLVLEDPSMRLESAAATSRRLAVDLVDIPGW